MRVLHLHSGNLYGGVETMLLALARERGAVPDMAPVFTLCFEGRLAGALRLVGSEPEVLGPVRLSRPHTVWRARRSLAAYLRQQAFDVAVCHQAWPYAIFDPTLRHAGLPRVLWQHTVSDGRRWLDRWASSHAPDLLVCNSQFTARAQAPQFPGTPCEWVHPPLSLNAVPALDRDRREQIRSQWQTPLGHVVVVQVGRFEPLKGHLTALQALATLRHLGDWTYWIVGGPQRPSDARYLRELGAAADRLGLAGRIRFLGERDDVPLLLGAADVYCQPNVQPEAFGLALVEALDAGLPVVTSGIGGACEIVDASCGILTPPGDSEAVARALRAVIADADLRARLGAAARHRPAALCHPPRQMQRIREILSSVVGAPARVG